MIVSTGKNMQTPRKFFKIIDGGVVDHTFLKPFNSDCVSKNKGNETTFCWSDFIAASNTS